MYSRIDEAIGISNGRVWVVFWKLVCNSHVGVETWKVNRARL